MPRGTILFFPGCIPGSTPKKRTWSIACTSKLFAYQLSQAGFFVQKFPVIRIFAFKNFKLDYQGKCTICGHFKHFRDIYLNTSFISNHLQRSNIIQYHLKCIGNRNYHTRKFISYVIRGESAALGRRMPWPNRIFFKKCERKNLEFFHMELRK